MPELSHGPVQQDDLGEDRSFTIRPTLDMSTLGMFYFAFAPLSLEAALVKMCSTRHMPLPESNP